MSRQATSTADRADADELTLLTALVAVLHRRGGQDTIRIGGTGLATIDLADDPGFAELTERIADATTVASVALSPVTVESVDLAIEDDHFELRADPSEVDGLRDQVMAALADTRERPKCPLSVLNLAGPDDPRLVAGFAGSGVAPIPARCVHELVDQQAARTPDAQAVTSGWTVLTYRSLVRAADRLAVRLVEAGVRADQVVGLLLPRSPELIVALLAVLKAGGAYLALDPEAPPTRLTDLLDGAGATVVLSTMDLARRVPGGHIVLLVDLTEPDDGPTRPPAVKVGPDNLAYVSYTSGSTGEPKGVSVPHRAVARLVSAPDWATFGPEDVFLQAAPVAFDAATLEIWAPLCNGGRLALLPPGQLDIEQVAETIRAEGVSVLWLTAGLFNQVVDGHLDQLAGVRQLIAGGDVVSPDAVARLLAAHPHLLFSNGYGPTENTTFTTCATIRAPYPGGPVPIGRPISGTRVAVLDPDLRPVPIGVAGELYAGGAGLARGYLGRPGATAQRFLPDPAGGGERLYRTGDLVRWRADGMLEFLGRADRQVKVNGYRIEPAEIESALLANANVRAAAVLAADSASGKRLVGYVVPIEEALDDGGLPSELRGWLRERLPGYLVPARIVALEEFPLTPNGKLDRAALPELNRTPRNVPNDYVAPNTQLERLLCDLWGDALGIADVGTDDDFFELGGHSLIAAELLARLQQEFGIELSARTLYLSPTVGELAELTELDSALVKQSSE